MRQLRPHTHTQAHISTHTHTHQKYGCNIITPKTIDTLLFNTSSTRVEGVNSEILLELLDGLRVRTLSLALHGAQRTEAIF